MSVELWGALILFLVAIALLWLAARQRRATGLPGGRVVYTDTRAWGKPEKALFDPITGLTGRPDYLVEHDEQIIPVEVKSGRTPSAPYDAHIYQLAAYCLLVEREYGKRPTHGIIQYERRSYAVDYTAELESALLDILAEIRSLDSKRNVSRSHDQVARCRGCGYRDICEQAL